MLGSSGSMGLMRNVLRLVCSVGSMGKNSIAGEGGEVGPPRKAVELGKI